MAPPFTPSRRSAVAPFEVMDVLATVARMRAEGREVISLCAGEPSQGAPGPVQAAAAAIHAEGWPLGYTPALGTAALRAAERAALSSTASVLVSVLVFVWVFVFAFVVLPALLLAGAVALADAVVLGFNYDTGERYLSTALFDDLRED